MTTDAKTTPLAKGEYNNAMERLSDVFGDDAEVFVEMIQTVRDDETFHDANAEQDGICSGCMAETIADAVTRAVNGKAA